MAISLLAVVMISTSCKKKCVEPAGVTSSFTYEITGYVEGGATIEFTNTSTSATSYLWDFGNGQTSTETNPTRVIGVSGDAEVKLKSTNGKSTATSIMKIEFPF